MSLTDWISSLFSGREARRADERRLAAAVDAVVDVVDPRLRGLPGYRRTLAPAIGQAARFAREIVAALPPAIEITRKSWSGTPFLRAGFATVDAMQQVFDTNRALRDFLTSAEARGAREIYAGIGMQMHRRQQLGQELRDELLQKDVEQVAVSFDNHRIGVIATTEPRVKELLQRRILEDFATRAMQRIVGMRSRRDALVEQRANLSWKLKIYRMQRDGLGTLWHDRTRYDQHINDLSERLQVAETNLDDLLSSAGTIEDFLDITVEEFSRAQETLRVDTTTIHLDDMNIERDPASPRATALELTEVRFGKRRPRVVQLVKFSPDFVRVDTDAALRRAARVLGV